MYAISISVSVLMYQCQENQKQYPTIFSFALDILPIQGTAVPFEPVYSRGPETDTLWRNRLGVEAMEALQMLKFSIRKGQGLNFTDGLDEALQIEELEALLHQQTLVPEDMQAFIRSLASHSIV